MGRNPTFSMESYMLSAAIASLEDRANVLSAENAGLRRQNDVLVKQTGGNYPAQQDPAYTPSS